MLHQPTAPQALADGYRTAAGLATTRQEECLAGGREREARLWRHLVEYCQGMADSKAIDDDQFAFQRRRHTREILMTREEMEALGLAMANPTRELPEWRWAVLELAMGYLPVRQKICFEMHIAGRLSYQDIAEALECEVREVRRHVQKARRTLRKHVKPKLEHIFDEHHKGASQ